ncbi:hypothetical protein SOCEGT47_045960 [Sorangium cellulosum]|uniref:Uncharacterized protein n=1 Tax=Sorangium cellulosum TaxID=56 RepID=A0A4P2Q539_SORCE|nr:hypothetical protein [Sorangium cellulosum]AUX24063.1 hypothetical protein SOCEGT47_045960 [Sorangium cellulosum]
MSKYTASEVIQLPRFTAVGAMALGEQLLTAAKPVEAELPKGITRAFTALASRHGALAAALRDQVSLSGGGEASEDAVQRDRVLDSCWSGLMDLLTAFTKLPAGTPEVAEASALKSAIFTNGGLKFLHLPFVLQWSESELRLQRIRKNGLDARIEALGGPRFLSALEAAHAAYGKALGVTAPAATPAEAPPSVREALDAFTEALRAYVIKVMGAVEPDEPETQALADRLLAPLASWSVGPSGRAAARKQGKPEADAGAPVPPGGEGPRQPEGEGPRQPDAPRPPEAQGAAPAQDRPVIPVA